MPPKGKKKPKQDPKEVIGAKIHAPANKVLGDQPAKRHFGSVNYNKLFLNGTVVSIRNNQTNPNGPRSIYITAE